MWGERGEDVEGREEEINISYVPYKKYWVLFYSDFNGFGGFSGSVVGQGSYKLFCFQFFKKIPYIQYISRYYRRFFWFFSNPSKDIISTPWQKITSRITDCLNSRASKNRFFGFLNTSVFSSYLRLCLFKYKTHLLWRGSRKNCWSFWWSAPVHWNGISMLALPLIQVCFGVSPYPLEW